MTASADDVNVDDLRRRARRRLVGAIVLALGAAVFVPMLLESDPKPLGEDVAVKIPPVDEGKFVNRLNDKGKPDATKPSPARGDAAKADAHQADAAKAEPPKTEPAKPEPPKADIAKDEPRNDAPKEAAPADAPKDSPPSPPPSARRTIAEAEQKMLGAPAQVAPAPAAKSPSAPASTPAPDAAPVAAPSPAVATTATAASAAPPAAQGDAAAGFSVQLAAFADDKGANALANKLKKAGYAAYTEPLATSKGTLWRVRVGPYPSREAAAAARDKLKGEGYAGIVAAAK
jgi:DedD protein